MKRISSPAKNDELLSLKAGDKVLISGEMFTARDKASQYLVSDTEIVLDLENSFLFHCGPIVKKIGNNFKLISAGPTTSERMEFFVEKILEKRKVKAFIGKGGFSKDTLEYFKKYKSVYFSATGGAGSFLAQKLKVKDVYFLEEFGSCEAIWRLEVKDFPCIVGIDSKGNSIYK